MCTICLVNKKESTLCRLFYLPTKNIGEIQSGYFEQNHQALWLTSGKWVVNLQYLISGSGTIGISLYNYTDTSSFWFSDNIKDPVNERRNITRIVELEKSTQIGGYAYGTFSEFSYQIDAIKIR